MALDDRELLDGVALHREPDAASRHGKVENFRKIFKLCRRDKRTVIRADIVGARGFARTPQKPHGGHHLLPQNCFPKFGVLSIGQCIAEILAHKINIALDRLNPCLAPPLGINPSGVGTVVDKFGERISEVFL